MTFELGEQVGPYRITERLGQGGMATVYRAYHANLDRYVAIKILHPAFKEDPSFLARFQREAQIIAKLEHPSIVPIYDYSEHNGEPYLVMKFIEGETLKARMNRQPLTLEETLKIMAAVAGALTYAHGRGVLHRDVKPSNVLMEKGDIPYLADFGLARIAAAGESTMSQDSLLGTPQYMSPEQAQGLRDLDGATDVYSLGVMLYEIVVGRVPFNADTPYAIVHDHIYSPLPIPSKVNPQVPPAVERVLLKSLAKDRRDRYTTPNLMIEAFRDGAREADMKELSAASYRVPVTAPPPSAPPVVPGLPPQQQQALPNTPIPLPIPGSMGMPFPGMSGASMGSSAVERYARQQRRRNLWVLFGFSLLVLTCISMLFISLSTYTAASEQGLFRVGAAAPPSGPVGQQPQGQAPLGGSARAGAPQGTPRPNETRAAPLRTKEATAPATAATAVADAQLSSVKPFVMPSQDDLDRALGTNPDDVRARVANALAFGQNKQPLKAEAEFQKAITSLKGDAKLAFEIGQELIAGNIQGAYPIYLMAYAYANGAETNPTIREEAGKYLYKAASNARKTDIILVNRLLEMSRNSSSAGLAAFATLGIAQMGEDDKTLQALKVAEAIKPATIAEVNLVRGVIFKMRSSTDTARKELEAAIRNAPSPQSWIVDEAKKQLKDLS